MRFPLLPLGLNIEGCLSWDSSVETMLSLTWTNSLISHSVLNLALCCQVILIALKTDSNFSSTLILIRRKTFKMDERWCRQQSPHSSISHTQKNYFSLFCMGGQIRRERRKKRRKKMNGCNHRHLGRHWAFPVNSIFMGFMTSTGRCNVIVKSEKPGK